MKKYWSYFVETLKSKLYLLWYSLILMFIFNNLSILYAPLNYVALVFTIYPIYFFIMGAIMAWFVNPLKRFYDKSNKKE